MTEEIDIAAGLATGRVITNAELESYRTTFVADLGNGVQLFRGLDDKSVPFTVVRAPTQTVMGARGLL